MAGRYDTREMERAALILAGRSAPDNNENDRDDRWQFRNLSVEGETSQRTSEAQLAVAEARVVRRAFLLHFSSAPAALDALIKLGPAVSACVFLQPLFLRPSVLKPHLAEINGKEKTKKTEQPLA